MRYVYAALALLLLASSLQVSSQENELLGSPPPSEIFGNAAYPAMSYGGYRGLSRNQGPTVEQLTDDLKILGAMGVKLLRTYNTSQYPQAERLLQAISTIQQDDPSFEMYVMLGAWIEAKNAWTRGHPGPDHTQENRENNTREIETAVRLANAYPNIVKAIAVGNEAMVQWAVNYFVYPKTILKWVNFLQEAKAAGELNAYVWITSSDNYESWGGGNSVYHTQDLTKLMQAVDFISVHTYPFHDSFYNPSFWGVLPEEESLSFEAMTYAAMERAVNYAQKQYQAVVDFMQTQGIDKPVHIGETGWASEDGAAYGSAGSQAADEYKQKIFYELMRAWTIDAGISLFFFEGFDEQWKKADSPSDSENHYGLVNLDNQVKYTLWSAFDAGTFANLTRDGKPLRKSFNGNESALLASAMMPPFKSQMAVLEIGTTNTQRKTGEPVTESNLVIIHDVLDGNGADHSYPSAPLKLIPWEGTSTIELLPNGELKVETRDSDWWGASLEVAAETGENLSQFKNGYLTLEIRGSSDINFGLGFQTGNYLRGDQVNNFAQFGPGTKHRVADKWQSYTLPIKAINGGANLTDVTNIIAFLGTQKAPGRTLYVRNIVYSKTR